MKKKILYSFAIVAMMGISMWALLMGFIGVRANDIETVAEKGSNSSWGLSFQVDGQSPIGNATPQYLKEYNAYYIDEEGAKRLAQAAEDCWRALQSKDIDAWGKACTASFEAQTAMFPNMITEHVQKAIDEYKDKVKGYKITGAGGGGYLVLINDKPIEEAIQIRIRRK